MAQHHKKPWPQRAFKRGGFAAVWREADHRGGWRPFRAAYLWAKGRADRLPEGSKFRHAAHVYEREYRKRRRRHRHHAISWPKHIVIEELFINDNGQRNHVHIASRDREALIQLGRIAQAHYSSGDSAAVREFPPFDPVEDVHVGCVSWHYRDSSNPDVGRCFAQRGNGLAFDLRSAAREQFAHEVKRRYGAKRSDF